MFLNSLNGDGNPKHDALNPTSNILTAYNGAQIKCTVDIDCNNSSIWTNTKFYVVDIPGPAVLGLPSCETLNVVTLHDQCLRSFMNTAKQNGLVLNSSIRLKIKCHFLAISIPDPQKVNDIIALPERQDKTELQQFLGMLTYLSSFIKDFSSKSSVLRDLLKKDVDFILEAHHQNAFDSLKSKISEPSLLNYYKPDQPVYLEYDASQSGLGAALLQYDENNQLQPMAYVSKSLTPTEQ